MSSLLIARASGRRRELAIRAAIGAGRSRLVRQLLTESLLLGVLGGLAGLLVGVWLIGLIVRVLPDAVPRAKQIALDPVVGGSALLMALVTGAIFGVAARAARLARRHGSRMKQGGERGSSGRARGRAVLVVGEIALTLVLLAGAGLLLNSFLRLRQVDSGMRPENVHGPRAGAAAFALRDRAVAGRGSTPPARSRCRAGPGSRPSASAFPGRCAGSNASGSFFIEGRPSTDRADQPTANLGSVSGGYFAAMGIPLITGRTFTEVRRGEGRRRRRSPA